MKGYSTGLYNKKKANIKVKEMKKAAQKNDSNRGVFKSSNRLLCVLISGRLDGRQTMKRGEFLRVPFLWQLSHAEHLPKSKMYCSVIQRQRAFQFIVPPGIQSL